MLIDLEEEREVRQYGCRDVRMTLSVAVVVVQAGIISEWLLSRVDQDRRRSVAE